MSNAFDSIEFQPDVLSVREREVLDLAVEGRTDEQIAQALGITVATVNSYWVRIRGKLGPLSRTEIVGMVLRHESNLRHADLIAEVSRLKESERRAQVELAQARTDARAHGATWHALALDHAPDALFVSSPPGNLIYANLQAQHLFAAEPGELETLEAWELAIEQDRELRREEAIRFFENGGPARMVVGVERPFYARRRDETNFRAILVAERFIAQEGQMAVLTIREFMSDIQPVLDALRKPYAVS